MNCVIFTNHNQSESLPRRDPRAKHLLKVLRLTEGGTFEGAVVGAYRGRFAVTAITADAVHFRRVAVMDVDPAYARSQGWTDYGVQPPLLAGVELALGYCRPLILKRVFRDGAAMGLKSFIVYGTDLGDPSYRQSRYLRDGGYAEQFTDGIAQCGDFRLPELRREERLADVLDGDRQVVVLDRIASTPASNTYHNQSLADENRDGPTNPYFWDWLGKLSAPVPVRLVVGSERGFSPRERQLVADESSGRMVCRMGPELVRADTAALAALSALWQRYACLANA